MYSPIKRVFSIPARTAELDAIPKPSSSSNIHHSIALLDDESASCETREFGKESGLMEWQALTAEEQESAPTMGAPLSY